MIKEYFEKLRFDKDHHTELGDIRLTIGQQEEIIKIFEEALKKQREICAMQYYKYKDEISSMEHEIINAPEPEL